MRLSAEVEEEEGGRQNNPLRPYGRLTVLSARLVFGAWAKTRVREREKDRVPGRVAEGWERVH